MAELNIRKYIFIKKINLTAGKESFANLFNFLFYFIKPEVSVLCPPKISCVCVCELKQNKKKIAESFNFLFSSFP